MSFHCQVTNSALLGLQQKEEKHWHDNNQNSKPTPEPVPSGKFGIKMEISFFCWHLQTDTLLGKKNRRKQGQRTAKIKVPAWHEPTPRPVPLKDSCWTQDFESRVSASTESHPMIQSGHHNAQSSHYLQWRTVIFSLFPFHFPWK